MLLLRGEQAGYPKRYQCPSNVRRGTLRPGQTRTLTVVFTAKPGFSLWGWHHKHAIKVKVIGFAAADQGFGGTGARSFSADYVTILPPGWWWA